MKLYDCAAAPSPRRVRMFLAEKGVEIPTEQVDLRHGGHFEEAFKAINPGCTVPVLALDDGTVISETAAVCRYLEAAFPDPPLMGGTPEEIGRVAMWDHYCETDGFYAMAEWFRNKAKGFKDHALTGQRPVAQIPELAERGEQRVRWFLSDLDRRLGDSAFVAGPTFSVADITAFVTLEFSRWMKMRIGDDQPNLLRWSEAVGARPSAQV